MMTKVGFFARLLKRLPAGRSSIVIMRWHSALTASPRGNLQPSQAARKQQATTSAAVTCNNSSCNTSVNSNFNASLQKSGQEGGVSQKRPTRNEKPDSEKEKVQIAEVSALFLHLQLIWQIQLLSYSLMAKEKQNIRGKTRRLPSA